MFAACVFGFLSVILGLFVLAVIIHYLQAPTLSNLMWVPSLASPIVPLSYFAFRGFRNPRSSAFESLPERYCGAASLSFLALGIVLGALSGSWAHAIGPAVAALLFALSIRAVREILLMLP